MIKTMNYLKICSAQRDVGTATDYKIHQVNPIERDSTYQLVYAHIPQTYYNIDASNNKFTIEEVNPGGSIFTIEVPWGFYSNVPLFQMIEDLLNSNPSATGIYTLTFDPRLQYVRINSTKAFRVLYQHVNRLNIGFGTDVNPLYKFFQEGTSIVDLEKIQSMNITVNDCISIRGAKHGSEASFNVVADVDILQVVDYTPPDAFPQVITFPQATSVIHVRLTNGLDNSPLDLHGSEWYMVLRKL